MAQNSNTLRMMALLLIIGAFLFSCSNPESSSKTEEIKALTGDYFGFEASDESQMFAKGIISTELAELNSVFSPDGNEFFFSITTNRHNYVSLVQYKRNNGVWEGPVIPSFSGKYSDADPFYSPDGQKLYFISQRPLNDSINEPKDYDIWYVERVGEDWSDAVNVGPTVNTGRHEYYISVTNNGTLYYATNYEDPNGPSFIHRAEMVDGEYVVTKLGEEINADAGGGDPYISQDEDMLIFTSRREGGFGSSDLYISFNMDGVWTEAMNMGSEINSESVEYCPMMSPDGKYFFFTSMRHPEFHSSEKKEYADLVDRLNGIENQLGNVYWLKSDFLDGLKEQAGQ